MQTTEKLFLDRTNAVVRALHAQDKLNERLNAQWKTQNWPFYRAIWTEMTEAIGHTDWFWWKPGTGGTTLLTKKHLQLHIELADALHFGLSMICIEAEGIKNSLEDHARTLVHHFDHSPFSDESLTRVIEEFIVCTIDTRRFDKRLFAGVCAKAGITLTQLLALYFAKQTLNKFRWDHGYSLPKGVPGAYIKFWPSLSDPQKKLEDNEHLEDILAATLTPELTDESLLGGLGNGSTEQHIYAALDKRYWSSNDRHVPTTV